MASRHCLVSFHCNWHSSYFLVSYHFNQLYLFSIFCGVGLIVMNSVFVYMWMSSFFLRFWRTVLLDKEFLVTRFCFCFPSEHFEYNSPLSLDSKVSAHNLIENPLYVMSHFSDAALKILSLSLSFEGLIVMCLSASLFEFILFGD